MQRGGQDGPRTRLLEGLATVAASREPDRAVDRNRDPPAPAADVAEDPITVAHHVEREDPVLVEGAESAKLYDGPLRNREHTSEILAHVDEGDVAQKLSVRVLLPSREVDPSEVTAHQRLRRLRPLDAAQRQGVLGRVEDLAELPPLHGRPPGV